MSCTWNGSEDRICAMGIHGRSRSRTITRWLPTPITTFLWLNLCWDHSWRIAVATVDDSATSPSRTAPGGSATSPYRTTVGCAVRAGPPLPNSTSAARTCVVPMSSPMTLDLAT